MTRSRKADTIEETPRTATLVVIGGAPGSGKSVLAERLARDMSLPLLSSDTIGGTIRAALRDEIEGPTAFRAGYRVLFSLAETFLRSNSSTILDTTMGWAFQWNEIDGIIAKLPSISFTAIILQCPREIAAERITKRHHDSNGKRANAADVMKRGHVWNYLEQLERADITTIDATQPPDAVYAQTLQHLRDQCPTPRS